MGRIPADDFEGYFGIVMTAISVIPAHRRAINRNLAPHFGIPASRCR
jgi:hypothetical protein